MLNLNNINFGYTNELVLKDFNLKIDKGERVAITGASGSGKSTILRIIAGLEKVQSGQVILDANDITSTPTHKRQIGFVFQGFALFPHLTVKKNIEYGISNLKKDTRNIEVNRFVKLLDIKDLLDRYPHELSGGQKQRVALARTLVTKPKVLLLDEPFSALDQNLKGKIRKELLETLARLEITTILVTHDKADAEVLCNRTISISKDSF